MTTSNTDWNLGVITVIPIIFVALGLDGKYVRDTAKKAYDRIDGCERIGQRASRLLAGAYRILTLLSVLFTDAVFFISAYALHVGHSNSTENLLTFIGLIYLFLLFLFFSFWQVKETVKKGTQSQDGG